MRSQSLRVQREPDERAIGDADAGEWRALATIEDSLDRSDPRLARMLTRFTLPASWGGVVVLARSLRQRIVSAVAVIAAFLFVLAVFLPNEAAYPPRSAVGDIDDPLN